MKYQPGEQVIFYWNFEKFPGTIKNYLKKKYGDNIYLVQFPPNSLAGRAANPREIAEVFLEKNTEIENIETNKKIIITI